MCRSVADCCSVFTAVIFLCRAAAADPGFGEGRFVPSPPSSPLPSPPLPFPPIPLPSLSPPLPSPPLFLPPFPPPPFPFLSLSRPYPFPPSAPLRSRTPLLRSGGLGERYKLPQRVRAEPGRQTFSGAFSAYLGAFWQAFSSNLSLVNYNYLPLLNFFRFFLSEM